MFLTPFVRQQFLDNDGTPLASGKVYTYLAGTTTPANTYTDSAGLTPNANPVILDAGGQAPIWIGAEALKFVIKDVNDTTIQTVDNITSSPITTAGDIIYGGASGIQTRLAKGAQGTVLQMGASYPEWAANPDLTTAAAKTSNYTILVSDDFVRFNATSGALTATFPSAVTSTNKVIIVQKTDSSFNAVTLSGTGMTTNYLMTAGETAAFVSDGTNWVQLWRVTDTAWTAYALTIIGTSSNPTKPNTTVNDAAKWRRIGDSIQFKYDYYHVSATGAAVGAGTYQFPIPNSSGWTIDSTKCVVPASPTLKTSVVGSSSISATSIGATIGCAYVSDATKVFLAGSNETATTSASSSGTPMTDTVVQFSFIATVPITNFSA